MPSLGGAAVTDSATDPEPAPSTGWVHTCVSEAAGANPLLAACVVDTIERLIDLKFSSSLLPQGQILTVARLLLDELDPTPKPGAP